MGPTAIDFERVSSLARQGFSFQKVAALMHIEEPSYEFEKAYAQGREDRGKEDEQVVTEEQAKDADEVPMAKARRTVHYTELSLKYEYRRAFSEVQLLDILGTNGFHFERGHCYCFISGGDVDSLSYLKAVLRQQPLSQLVVSTWCMAVQDIIELREWIEAGRIEKMDIYLGEIFKGSYAFEYATLKELYEQKPELGRMAIFRNHSKVMAGRGEKFSFAILSSANINTNPRCEQACIIIDDGAFEFYKDFFDGINSFE